MQTKILEVSIPSFRKERSKVEYQINIISNCIDGERCYIRVYKRYSEFLDLHSKIKHKIPGLPLFPKKRLFSSFNISVIEERRELFQKYVQYAYSFVVMNGFEKHEFGKALFDFIKVSSPY